MAYVQNGGSDKPGRTLEVEDEPVGCLVEEDDGYRLSVSLDSLVDLDGHRFPTAASAERAVRRHLRDLRVGRTKSAA